MTEQHTAFSQLPRCSKCGAPLQPGYSFCSECGTPIAGSTPAAPSTAPQPPRASYTPPAASAQPAAAYSPPQPQQTAAAAKPRPRFSRKNLLSILAALLAVCALVEFGLLLGAGRSDSTVYDYSRSGPSVSEQEPGSALSQRDYAAIKKFAPSRDGYSDFYLAEPIVLLHLGESAKIKLTLKHLNTALYYTAPDNLSVQCGSFAPIIGQSCTVTVTALNTGVSTVSFTNSANREEIQLLVIAVN